MAGPAGVGNRFELAYGRAAGAGNHFWHRAGGKREAGDVDPGRRQYAHLGPSDLPAAGRAESADPCFRGAKPARVSRRSGGRRFVALDLVKRKENPMLRRRTSVVLMAVLT